MKVLITQDSSVSNVHSAIGVILGLNKTIFYFTKASTIQIDFSKVIGNVHQREKRKKSTNENQNRDKNNCAWIDRSTTQTYGTRARRREEWNPTKENRRITLKTRNNFI